MKDYEYWIVCSIKKNGKLLPQLRCLVQNFDDVLEFMCRVDIDSYDDFQVTAKERSKN